MLFGDQTIQRRDTLKNSCSKKRGISSLVGSLLQACKQLGQRKEKRAGSGVEGGVGVGKEGSSSLLHPSSFLLLFSPALHLPSLFEYQ